MAGKTEVNRFQHPADFLRKRFLHIIKRGLVIIEIVLFFFCAYDDLQSDHAGAPLENQENTLRYDVNTSFGKQEGKREVQVFIFDSFSAPCEE